MKDKGYFISFEGIDGSGKSTQIQKLAEFLEARDFDIVITREPGGSKGGEEIRNLLLQGNVDRWSAETEILLFTAVKRRISVSADHLSTFPCSRRFLISSPPLDPPGSLVITMSKSRASKNSANF